jgi:5-formyltetrahydrofolate cyclo-ligase
MSDVATRRALRASLRRARLQLQGPARRDAAKRIARHLAALPWLRPGVRMAAFIATPEEIDATPCIIRAVARDVVLFLPRVTQWRSGRMSFAPVGPRRRINRYGIPEPDTPQRLGARWMQIILVPLVGVDAAGNRLGMGAGFYDRALEFRRWRTHWRGPRLVGIAHSSQQVEAIPFAPHDIPLDAVITERGVSLFRRPRS